MQSPPSFKACPFCGDKLPSPVYDEKTHQSDLTDMTRHIWSCGAESADKGGRGMTE